MRVLLLSPYDAHSHRRWRKGLVAAFPDWQWTVLTLPARFFLWRVRGNSLSWAFSEREILERAYDALVVTSMTDLSALRGMVPSLAKLPALVYCHENQFAYPDRREQSPVEPRMVNLYTLLAAERVVFNSVWNRDSFLQGAAGFLRQMPDAVPAGVIESIANKSRVIPVPLEAHWYEPATRAVQQGDVFTIVWNHRWEYDKAPERLFDALLGLQQAGLDFRVHVIGQQFRNQPPVFAELQARLHQHIGQWGMVASDQEYRQLLRCSHVVLTTALHEFQGLAVLEAVACGCVPVVPDRLSYPEFFPPAYRYPSYPDDAGRESAAIAAHLKALCASYYSGELPQPPALQNLSWPSLAAAYAEEISSLA